MPTVAIALPVVFTHTHQQRDESIAVAFTNKLMQMSVREMRTSARRPLAIPKSMIFGI